MSKKVITFYDSEKQEHDFPIITPDYGVCNTIASDANKIVTCDEFTLFTGATVTVNFKNAPTTNTISLNVNDSGLIAVDFNSNDCAAKDEIKANGCYDFIYNGTKWIYKGSSANKVDKVSGKSLIDENVSKQIVYNPNDKYVHVDFKSTKGSGIDCSGIKIQKLSREDSSSDYETSEVVPYTELFGSTIRLQTPDNEATVELSTTGFTIDNNKEQSSPSILLGTKAGDIIVHNYTTNEQHKLSEKANSSDVLEKTNTTEFTPTGDYQPATKKYVDEKIDLSTLDNKVDKVVGKSLIDENVADNLSGDTTTVRIKKGTELKTNGSEINGVHINGNSVTVGAIKNDMSDPYIGYKNVMDEDGLHIYGVDYDGNQDTNERVDITSSGVKYSGAQGNGRTLKLGFEETDFPQLIIEGNPGESKSVKIDFNDVIIHNDSTTHKLSEKADSIELERIKYYGDKDVIPSPESYFTVNTDGDTVTGLTDEGKTQTELVIPYEINGKKITCITGSESQNNTSVKSIKLPNSIDTIGEMAFWYYTALTSINIPDSVVTINTAAFLGCAVLKSIDIPDSVTTIRDRVFYGCYALTSVKIPKNVTTINDYTFSDCEQLKSLYIPRSVTSIVDTSGHTILSTTTIYCEQGSYAATYAKEVNIPVVYTDIKSTALDNKVDKVEGKSLIDENVASRIQVESSDNSLFVASTDSSVGWKYTPGAERLEYLSPIGSPMTLTYAPAEGFKVVYEYGTPDITVIRSDGTHKLSEKANTSDVLVKNSSGNFVYGGTTISETQVSVMGHNLTNKWEGNVYDINVPVSTWTEMTDTDNQKYYYKKITVSGMTASGQAMTDVAMSDSVATARKEMEAYQCVNRVVTGDGHVELYCFDEIPTTTFTLKVLVLGNVL